MLGLHDRSLLLEALRPPDGFVLDRALGTTFSLDLLSLLVVPLAFTFFDWEDPDGGVILDPLIMLQAVRRHAGRIRVFCQAGQIEVPRMHRQLYGYLEDSVVEVRATSPEGVFHPKVWILRFTGANEPVRYRLVCLTRNLTFDKSWDTILTLDGKLVDRTRSISASRVLADFFAALPGLACRPVPPDIAADVELLQQEVRRTRFEPPDGFESFRFWPLGLSARSKWPIEGRVDRLLVVAPFLSPSCLTQLAAGGKGNILVGGLKDLAKLEADDLKGFEQVLTMNPDATLERAEDGVPAEDGTPPLVGLHAKLFVADAGWSSRLWTGSANATHSAFRHNVEFLVELQGKKSDMGIDAILGKPEDRGSLRSLLVPLGPRSEPAAVDAEQESLDALVEAARRELAAMALSAQVLPGEREREFEVQLTSAAHLEQPHYLAKTTVRCWPVSLVESAFAVAVAKWTGVVARFASISFEALTSFYAFDVCAETASHLSRARFVVNLPLEGAPEGRREEILRTLLQSREQVLRFLLLLLAGQGMPIIHDIRDDGNESGNSSRWLGLEGTLFETLMQALDRDPGRLDQVAAVVADLECSPGGASLLPEGFHRLWEPIREAHRSIPHDT